MASAAVRAHSSAAKPNKSYLILGDDDDEGEQDVGSSGNLQEQHSSQPSGFRRTVQVCDAADYPQQIWQAAKLCSDQGHVVLTAYDELKGLRCAIFLGPRCACCACLRLPAPDT